MLIEYVFLMRWRLFSAGYKPNYGLESNKDKRTWDEYLCDCKNIVDQHLAEMKTNVQNSRKGAVK